MKLCIKILLLCVIILLPVSKVSAIPLLSPPDSEINRSLSVNNSEPDLLGNKINKLKKVLNDADTVSAKPLVAELQDFLVNSELDQSQICRANYYLGVYFLYTEKNTLASSYLATVITIKENEGLIDTLYAKACYNRCLALMNLGDYYQLETSSLKALNAGEIVFGKNNTELLVYYSIIGNAKLELQKYGEVISLFTTAIRIAGDEPKTDILEIMSGIYNNLGVCYQRLADYSKAKLYLDKAELIINQLHIDQGDDFNNLLNSLAIVNLNLNQTELSDKYFNKAISLGLSQRLVSAYLVTNNYAIILGKRGSSQKGEKLLYDAVQRAEIQFGKTSRRYFEVLSNYANYLKEYKIDLNKSFHYYQECLKYLSQNTQDQALKSDILIGYAGTLDEMGKYEEALKIIQSELFHNSSVDEPAELYSNPVFSDLKSDRKSLNILNLKYKILRDLYNLSNNTEILEAASSTSELFISVLERIRININEEESRLLLGDRYRDSYIRAIRDNYMLYNIKFDRKYLEKAFGYSEKVKMAGLLAAARELKAAQFQIPPGVARLEQNLRRDIMLYNDLISQQLKSEKENTSIVNNFREKLLKLTTSRDSLLVVFENQYPEYYNIKYNTNVTALEDIPGLIGRNGNYINYVYSDTVIYVFVANRRNQRMLSLKNDSLFRDELLAFRKLLSMPGQSDNARMQFELFQLTGNDIYQRIFEPVIPFLISGNIIISPDNLISFIPFETLPSSTVSSERFLYRSLRYLMNDYDISYTYSATFIEESRRKVFNTDNNLIAFAPNYPEPINIQNVFNSRQATLSYLPDLPNARKEAQYVSDITGGKLFINKDARESVFKSEAGKYEIIHLAMHTLLNDDDPMYSTLIFSPENDSINEGYLKTYELYNIPLKARMVVLSSCNTGNGHLSTGEGILSLARGFIYTGSQSVVMSLWEIEDKSGTEIVKYFYENLKKGDTKSEALKNARLTYLKEADDLRAHPYFWSTLVIYGNNASLYYNKLLFFGVIFIASSIAVGLVLYFRRRRYS